MSDFFFLMLFNRSVGRWLTNITPLLPLFTSENCTLQMKHPFWERAWKPSLNIRLSDHIKCKCESLRGSTQPGSCFVWNRDNRWGRARGRIFHIMAYTGRLRPKRVTGADFTYFKGGGFFVEVYERVVVNLSFRFLKGPLIKKFRTDGPWMIY